MTPTQQKAVKDALEALETLLWWAVKANLGSTCLEAKKRADALREALAEQTPLFKPLIDQHPGLAEELAEQDDDKSDAERLDALDRLCESYGFEDIQEGNRWSIEGPFRNVREAIDAARSKT